METANVELDGEGEYPTGIRPGRYVCLPVSDTDVGMTPDVRDRVFDGVRRAAERILEAVGFTVLTATAWRRSRSAPTMTTRSTC
jgi:hypothetical protein